MKRKYGAHYLAFLDLLNEGDSKKLATTVGLAKDAGCELFELAYQPLNNMPAKEVAASIKAGGMTEAAMCLFFPGDGLLGNPPGEGAALGLAKKTVAGLLDYIQQLRDGDIIVEIIDGPSGFLLGHRYDLTDNVLLDRMVTWYQWMDDVVSGKGLTVCVERLRPSEDYVIRTTDRWIAMLDAIGRDNIQAHFDSYHAVECGEDPAETIKMLGNRIHYVHANGSMRLCPGTKKSDRLPGDEVPWENVGQALKSVGYQGPIVPEPFGSAVCQAIPALGDGVVPVNFPMEFYIEAKEHLVKTGVLTA